MFTASISSQTSDFVVKRSFNTLKLIFLSEEVYLFSYMIYYMIINANNQNNSIAYDKKNFNKCVSFKTAYYNI